MKTNFLSTSLLLFLITACSKSIPVDTVESLVANPDRLKDIRQRCRDYHTDVSEELCAKASDAWRKKFMGTGSAKYTPQD